MEAALSSSFSFICFCFVFYLKICRPSLYNRTGVTSLKDAWSRRALHTLGSRTLSSARQSPLCSCWKVAPGPREGGEGCSLGAGGAGCLISTAGALGKGQPEWECASADRGACLPVGREGGARPCGRLRLTCAPRVLMERPLHPACSQTPNTS